MTNDPRAVADGIALSRKTLRVIKVNLMWAFSYNAVALPLAIIGSLAPTQAAIAMALSSFLVVTNSLRLLPDINIGTPLQPSAAYFRGQSAVVSSS